MRRVVLTGARFVLLAGPVALAFFTGGFFDEPRAWAGLIAWALVVVAVLASDSPLPRGRGPRLALGGLALFAVWTLMSTTWAPIAGSAYHAGQQVILYAGGLLGATLLLRSRGALRAVEPALAAGTLVVVGYGISERLLPGLLHFQRSVTAHGRLEQPLTYWNAMGEVAAIGVVLCARLAGDASRPRRLRAAAAAAAAPLGMGLYLSFSRGALFACAAGLVTLIVAAPRREQVRGVLLVLAAGVLASIAASPFGGVTSLTGALSTPEQQGAIAFGLLAVIMVAAALAQLALRQREHSTPVRLPRHAPVVALLITCAGLGIALAFGAKEGSAKPLSAGPTRYETLQSNRYEYWRVAILAFGDEPLRGVGAGGWAVYWLRYRSVSESARDAHSLFFQTAAELGLVGLSLLAVFLGGIALAAREANARAPDLAAGSIAGFVAYVAHAPLDWDWQMPAVTLMGVLLAGTLLALADDSVCETVAQRSESDDLQLFGDARRLAAEHPHS
jgi:O-antigen ligase